HPAAQEDKMGFLGDYIDPGPDSRGVGEQVVFGGRAGGGVRVEDGLDLGGRGLGGGAGGWPGGRHPGRQGCPAGAWWTPRRAIHGTDLRPFYGTGPLSARTTPAIIQVASQEGSRGCFPR